MKSHGKVTGAVTVINVFWLFPLAVAAWSWPHLGALVAAIAYIPLIWLAFRFNAGVEEAKAMIAAELDSPGDNSPA